VKHVLYGQKSMFLGDEATNALLDYAAHVAQLRTGGRVDLRAYTDQGNLVVVTFLLNAATGLVAESTDLTMTAPDNSGAIAYMRQQIEKFSLSADFFHGFGLDGDDGRAARDGDA
jgi:hypothetical protein